jgi:hypothetical protein
MVTYTIYGNLESGRKGWIRWTVKIGIRGRTLSERVEDLARNLQMALLFINFAS